MNLNNSKEVYNKSWKAKKRLKKLKNIRINCEIKNLKVFKNQYFTNFFLLLEIHPIIETIFYDWIFRLYLKIKNTINLVF